MIREQVLLADKKMRNGSACRVWGSKELHCLRMSLAFGVGSTVSFESLSLLSEFGCFSKLAFLVGSVL